MATLALCSLKNVERKHINVNPAITLSVKAKIVFNLASAVFMFTGSKRVENAGRLVTLKFNYICSK